jgi:hypothetical protein
VLERVIARAYQNAGAHDEAIRWSLEALAVTPMWDPEQVAAVCNTVAWSLHLSGDLVGARTWAERALEVDPTHPYAFGTYCETLGKTDPPRAAAVHRFLVDAGYSPSLWGDYRPSKDLAKTKAIELDLDRLPKRALDDVHRHVIARRFDHNATPHERDHGAALLLRGAAHAGPALLAARLAMETATGDARVQSKVLFEALGAEVDAELRAAVSSAKDRYAKAPEKRAAAVKKLVAAKNEAALREMVLDPHYGVSMAACEGLVTLDRAGDLRAYLEAASAMNAQPRLSGPGGRRRVTIVDANGGCGPARERRVPSVFRGRAEREGEEEETLRRAGAFRGARGVVSTRRRLAGGARALAPRDARLARPQPGGPRADRNRTPVGPDGLRHGARRALSEGHRVGASHAASWWVDRR